MVNCPWAATGGAGGRGSKQEEEKQKQEVHKEIEEMLTRKLAIDEISNRWQNVTSNSKLVQTETRERADALPQSERDGGVSYHTASLENSSAVPAASVKMVPEEIGPPKSGFNHVASTQGTDTGVAKIGQNVDLLIRPQELFIGEPLSFSQSVMCQVMGSIIEYVRSCCVIVYY